MARSLFDTARQYRESIDVYGRKASVKWPLIKYEPHILHMAKKPQAEISQLIKAMAFAQLLPDDIRQFTTRGVYDLAKTSHRSFAQ